ncbi:hypothetical protein ACQ86N_10345 [Puia sp. P3]|uniref:hypothetical protein n=1 Tax=Puia sp. P3 TaxID=3423952 RepID=UPI003D66A78D
MRTCASLAEAMADLRDKGYEEDFDVEAFGLYSGDDQDMEEDPQDFRIDEVILIGECSGPDDNTVVYAVTYCTGVKGIAIGKHEADSSLPR